MQLRLLTGWNGEIRYGEVEASDASMRRVIQRIIVKFDRVHFCYETGSTGYGLPGLIKSLGHDCIVAKVRTTRDVDRRRASGFHWIRRRRVLQGEHVEVERHPRTLGP